MNQQRQPITETRYPIDQTIPHQLVVSKILGALMCHPAFRIIQHEGQRPFVTPTDSLADLRGSCDIAVSLDGSMKYGLVIEAKTTAHSEGGAWKIFKAVREERRNALQFERLVNAAPRWWYLIVRTDKLTAKTHEEHDRNLLDCPAILVDGKQGDQVPEDFIGPLRFGEMLQFLGDRLHISSSTPIKMPSREQLSFPIDDVPVVTMETPLKTQLMGLKHAGDQAAGSKVVEISPPISNMNAEGLAGPTCLQRLPSEGFGSTIPFINSVFDSVGERVLLERLTAIERAYYEKYVRMLIENRFSSLIEFNTIRREFGLNEYEKFQDTTRLALRSKAVILILAVMRARLDDPSLVGVASNIGHRFDEFSVLVSRKNKKGDHSDQRVNAATMAARQVLKT